MNDIMIESDDEDIDVAGLVTAAVMWGVERKKKSNIGGMETTETT